MLPEMLLEHGYNTFCLGKWHLSPSEDNTPAGPFHRWPLGRGFERFYGFLGGETNQWYPGPDPGQRARSRSRGAPRTATTSARTSPTRRSRSSSTRTSTRPRSRSSCTTRPARRTRRTTCPPEWADRYKGRFDDGWDAYRETVFARQQELGLLPADAELSPRDPDVPEWSALSDDERRLYARMMEVFAGLRVARRPPLRPHPRHARADRRARQHADHGHLRQRRLGRGRRRSARSTRCCSSTTSRRASSENLAKIDELGGPGVLQPLPVGLDLGGQHAVPPLEAGDLPRRGDRSVHPLLAGRDGGPRRGPHPVRPRDRHGARPCSMRSASSRRRRSAASRSRRSRA